MQESFVKTIHGHTLDLDFSETRSKKKNLTTLCTDLFLIAIRMQEAEDLGDPASLRKLIMHYIEGFKKNCKAINVDTKTIDNAIYFLVALLDETVMSTAGECRNYWITNPIQLELFGNNIAGKDFFRRLEELLKESKKMKDALEICYLCLCLGFEGKYKIDNSQELDDIIENLSGTLLKAGKRSVSGLSPHGRRILSPDLLKRKKLVPLWVIGLIAAFLLSLWWGVMYFLTEKSSEKVLSILG